MIDYLERMLEQQTEETGQPPDWFAPSRGWPAGRAKAAAQPGNVIEGTGALEGWKSGAVYAAAAENGEELWSRRAAGESAARSDETPVPTVSQPAVRESGRQPTNVDFGGVQRPGRAAWLYQRVRQSGARAEYTRPAAAQLTLPAPQGTADSQSVSPEGLDRIFRRDARRYDGEFTLY